MEIEHVGKFQLDLIPFELANGRWAAYLAVRRFDDRKQDFVHALEKQRVGDGAEFASAQEAIEAARRIGNQLVETGKIPES
jgi:hypothetical protein